MLDSGKHAFDLALSPFAQHNAHHGALLRALAQDSGALRAGHAAVRLVLGHGRRHLKHGQRPLGLGAFHQRRARRRRHAVVKLGDDLRELYETIRVNVDEEEQWKVFDFVEDFFWEELEIGDYINDINSYHLHMFDKHDVATKKLDVIVEKAGEVDANYAAQIEGYCSLFGEYGKKFETVCAMLALDLIGVKVFRYSDETAEAVASGEKLLKESGTIYESFADMMSPDDAAKYLDFLANGSREGLTSAELAGVEKADALLVSRKVGYEDVWDLRNAGDLMKKETLEKLKEFNISDCQECLLGEKYVNFEEYLNHTVCGEGMVGENNYLLLWEKNEIEELNDDYETQAFLNNIILIGSDGGDMAYGIDISGKYIEVPFIGMDDEEVKVIAEDFDGFIDYVWNRK